MTCPQTQPVGANVIQNKSDSVAKQKGIPPQNTVNMHIFQSLLRMNVCCCAATAWRIGSIKYCTCLSKVNIYVGRHILKISNHSNEKLFAKCKILTVPVLPYTVSVLIYIPIIPAPPEETFMMVDNLLFLPKYKHTFYNLANVQISINLKLQINKINKIKSTKTNSKSQEITSACFSLRKYLHCTLLLQTISKWKHFLFKLLKKEILYN